MKRRRDSESEKSSTLDSKESDSRINLRDHCFHLRYWRLPHRNCGLRLQQFGEFQSMWEIRRRNCFEQFAVTLQIGLGGRQGGGWHISEWVCHGGALMCSGRGFQGRRFQKYAPFWLADPLEPSNGSSEFSGAVAPCCRSSRAGGGVACLGMGAD